MFVLHYQISPQNVLILITNKKNVAGCVVSNCSDAVRIVDKGVVYCQNAARLQNVAEFAAFPLAEMTTTESVFSFVPEGVYTESYENLENTGCVAIMRLKTFWRRN